jgi:hypothetical protein
MFPAKLMFEVTAAKIAATRRSLARMQGQDKGVVSLSFFSDEEVQVLRETALRQEFRRAQTEIKHKNRSVFQDFDVCFPAPRIDAFEVMAEQLEATLFAASQSLPHPPFCEPFQLNDFAIQNYPVGAKGIGIHRDGARYRHVVVIVTLDGESRLFTCDHRQGGGKRRIDDRPGRIVLLSASGFDGRNGEEARPLHGVDRVLGGRLSLGFRVAPTNL